MIFVVKRGLNHPSGLAPRGIERLLEIDSHGNN